MMYVGKNNAKQQIEESVKKLAEQVGFQKAVEMVGFTMAEYVAMKLS